MIEMLRRGLMALTWLAAALAISLGASGIVAGMEGPSSDAVRSGRTAHDDGLVVAALDPIEAELRLVGESIERLGGQARGTLAALSANDNVQAEATIAAGNTLLADILTRLAGVRTAFAAVPLVRDPAAAYRLSPVVRDRHTRAAAAVDATRDLEADWTRFTFGSFGASRVSTLLADHDAAVVEAAAHGRDAEYDAALASLDGADAAITAARTIRNQLAATVDVTTLDAWLDRSSDYDTALRNLYVAVRAAGGRVTAAVRRAMAAEAAAKTRLPPDTRSLVLIMAEIGRGGMNASAIAIEQARQDIVEALAPPIDPPAP
ncbi:MAG: hypothetical protein ACXW4T_05755 [Candidatus Limnocylindrales bacterium]